eukprot:8302764-Lingulodinium_polyedra.AAC.1
MSRLPSAASNSRRHRPVTARVAATASSSHPCWGGPSNAGRNSRIDAFSSASMLKSSCNAARVARP